MIFIIFHHFSQISIRSYRFSSIFANSVVFSIVFTNCIRSRLSFFVNLPNFPALFLRYPSEFWFPTPVFREIAELFENCQDSQTTLIIDFSSIFPVSSINFHNFSSIPTGLPSFSIDSHNFPRPLFNFSINNSPNYLHSMIFPQFPANHRSVFHQFSAIAGYISAWQILSYTPAS